MDMDEVAQRVRSERKARRWTQQQLADKAGTTLRSVSGFETREVYKPQADNLRKMLAALGLEDEAGDADAEESREEWPSDVRVFLDVVGMFLVALPERERQGLMHEVTRQIVKR